MNIEIKRITSHFYSAFFRKMTTTTTTAMTMMTTVARKKIGIHKMSKFKGFVYEAVENVW